MAKPTWRILALSALLGGVAHLSLAVPAQAQMVIGGSGQPDVVVNWSVLDSLGQQPSLADMLKDDLPGRQDSGLVPPGARKAKPSAGPQGLTYKPYKPGKAAAAKPAAAKPAKVAAAPKPAAPKPVAAKPAAVAAAAPAPGPQISLPEVKPVAPAPLPAKVEAPKPAPVEPAKPVEIAKPAEPAKVVEVPKPAPVEPAKPVEVVKPAEPVAAPAPVTPPAPVTEVAKVVEPPKPTASQSPPMLAPVPPPAPVMPQQVASLPSSEPPAIGGSDTISLAFEPEESRLGVGARDSLAALVKRMQKDEDLNLQLLAYAAGDEASASKARRLSLSRALEVRKVLMDKGIRSTRIEVRALGNKMDGRGSPDRVDAVLVGR